VPDFTFVANVVQGNFLPVTPQGAGNVNLARDGVNLKAVVAQLNGILELLEPIYEEWVEISSIPWRNWRAADLKYTPSVHFEEGLRDGGVVSREFAGFAATVSNHKHKQHSTAVESPPLQTPVGLPIIFRSLVTSEAVVISQQMEFKDKYFSLLEQGAKPAATLAASRTWCSRSGPRAGSFLRSRFPTCARLACRTTASACSITS
jgi:hypothetical protein